MPVGLVGFEVGTLGPFVPRFQDDDLVLFRVVRHARLGFLDRYKGFLAVLVVHGHWRGASREFSCQPDKPQACDYCFSRLKPALAFGLT